MEEVGRHNHFGGEAAVVTAWVTALGSVDSFLSGPCTSALVLFASCIASTFLDPTWQPGP